MPEKPLAALMREAQVTSERYHELANLVSGQIVEFDAWLAGLPGKLEVEACTDNPNYDPDYNSDRYLVVGIKRFTKEWGLAFVTAKESQHPDFTYDDPEPNEWKPLRDAPLRLKAEAVRLLPQLVEMFLREQKSLIEAMEPANRRQGAKGGSQ
jgi:hypothetical protein